MKKHYLLFTIIMFLLLVSCQSAQRYGCKGKRCVEVSKKTTIVKNA